MAFAVRGTFLGFVFVIGRMQWAGLTFPQVSRHSSPARIPVRSARRKATATEWEMVVMRVAGEYLIALSMSLICDRVMTTSRWSGARGRRTFFMGLTSIQPQSRRAASRTHDNNVNSLRIVPVDTVLRRSSRHCPRVSVVMLPIGLSIGRSVRNAAMRTCSHRAPRWVGAISSPYLRRASPRVCFSLGVFLTSARISVSRAEAQFSASRLVRKTPESLTPWTKTCARYPLPYFEIDDMRNPVGNLWGVHCRLLRAGSLFLFHKRLNCLVLKPCGIIRYHIMVRRSDTNMLSKTKNNK
ncbi:hypothetical protein CCP4SC76_3060002 [Gammaproteobacteria bacterium]